MITLGTIYYLCGFLALFILCAGIHDALVARESKRVRQYRRARARRARELARRHYR